MPYNPAQPCVIVKHQESGTVKEYQLQKTRNMPAQSIEDCFKGITAKTIIKSLIPQSKTQFKENLKCFIRQKASTTTFEAN